MSLEHQNAQVSDNTAGRVSDGGGISANSSEIQSGFNNFSDIKSSMQGPDTSNLQNLQLVDSKSNNNAGDDMRVADASQKQGEASDASSAAGAQGDSAKPQGDASKPQGDSATSQGDSTRAQGDSTRSLGDANRPQADARSVDRAVEGLDTFKSPMSSHNGARVLQESLTDARSKFGGDDRAFADQFAKQFNEKGAGRDVPEAKANGNSVDFKGPSREFIRATFDQNGKANLQALRPSGEGQAVRAGDFDPQGVVTRWNDKRMLQRGR